MFSDFANFILDIVKMLIRYFMTIKIDGISYLHYLVAVSLLGIFLGAVVVNFSPKNIHFSNYKSKGGNDEEVH